MKLQLKVTEEEEEEELPQLVISQEINERVWARGIEKPPRKIKTRVTKDRDGNVTVYLAENSIISSFLIFVLYLFDSLLFSGCLFFQ